MRWPWALLILLHLPAVVLADGGTLRASRVIGPVRLTVFTAPTPMNVGPIDVSVLIQERTSLAIQPETRVWVRARSLGASSVELEEEATAEAATNKLFKMAQLTLTEPGPWRIEIALERHGPAHLEFDIIVEPPPPAWMELAPWVGWPALVIGLFAMHQWLAQRRSRLRARSGA